MNNTNLGIERSFEEFKADKKRKWQEFFSSSSEDSQSDNDNSFLVGTGSQNCVNLPTKNFSAGKLDNDESHVSNNAFTESSPAISIRENFDAKKGKSDTSFRK